jgi:hypothetical protein
MKFVVRNHLLTWKVEVKHSVFPQPAAHGFNVNAEFFCQLIWSVIAPLYDLCHFAPSTLTHSSLNVLHLKRLCSLKLS